MPRVSIVTPVYNDEDFVVQTIEAVRSQTFRDWEYILVDDGSTDRSVELVEAQVAEDGRLRLLRQANSGASTARNVGHAATCKESEFLLFLDHDDVLLPEMLETLVGYLDAHPEAGVVYSRFDLIDHEGNVSTHGWDHRFRPGLLSVSKIPEDEPETPFEALLMWGGILPSNALIRRSVYDSVTDGFDPKYFSDDTDVFMRLGLATTIHRLNQRLMLYRRHPSQMSWDADRTSASLDHLLADKWEHADLSPADRRRFERGMNLRRYGAYVPTGIDAGLRRARAGELARAARFVAGAVRREVLYVAANLGLYRPTSGPTDPRGPRE